MSPRVTLVMPVYNGASYLARAITSALGQDYDNFEIIIVNDGSTDEQTERIACAFRDANPHRIRYIHQENGGVSAALNTAIAVATGDFFCWLSHDDIFYSDRLKSQVNFHSQIGIADACVFSNFSLIDSEGKTLSGPLLGSEIFTRNPELALLHSGINGCTLLIPMSLMRFYGPFDTALRYTQDYDLWARMLKNHPFFFNDNELVRYRVHAEQGTQNPAAILEGDQLWIRLMDEQDEIRRVQMFGSRRRYYAAMAKFLGQSSPYRRALAHAESKMRADNSELLVTVLLVVTDNEEEVLQSLETVLNQSHGNWELFLLATREMCSAQVIETAVSNQSRVQWLKGEGDNADSYNRGIEAARGDYIAFIEAGDSWFPNHLSKQIETMVEEGSVVGHGSYLAWWKDLSTKRVAIIHDERSVTSVDRSLSPIDVAFSTLMIHRIVIAAGVRFEVGSSHCVYLFLAVLGNLYDWIGVREVLTEVRIGVSTPQIDLTRRTEIEQACRKHVPPSERLFCSLQLEVTPELAVKSRNDLIDRFADGMSLAGRDGLDPREMKSQKSVGMTPDESGSSQIRAYTLFISHDFGGGTERLVQNRFRQVEREGLGVCVLRRVSDTGTAAVSILDSSGAIRTTVDIDVNAETFGEKVNALNIENVEIHSLLTLQPNVWVPLLKSLRAIGITYSVHVHDYMTVCPRLFMVLPNGDYCGQPDVHGCERCIAQHGGIYSNPTVSSWRAVHGQMLTAASQVIVPDEDVRQRLRMYFPGIEMSVRPHPSSERKLRRVLVLGHCHVHKGSETLVKTARAALQHNSPIEFVLLGTSDREDALRELSNVRMLGPYRDAALVGLIEEINADFVWFPGQAAETFSFTLSDTFEAGGYPVSFDIGAIASRIRATGRGTVLPIDLAKKPEALLDRLLSLEVGQKSSLTEDNSVMARTKVPSPHV
ncbi:glycosyltransferase [Rhizobium sp. LjRoot98]|uniref:glycosyltransferase n=1 Tax=Rhizobium sp. LjRoot98 TaxID=3342345 RepID=UPI003ED1158E